jgi:polysaccharide biosynthesis protein PslA
MTSRDPPPGSTVSVFTWREARIGAHCFTSQGALLRLPVHALVVGDPLVIGLTSWLAYWIRHKNADPPLDIWAVTFLATALNCQAMSMKGGYQTLANEALGERVRQAIKVWLLAVGVLGCITELTEMSQDFSRTWAITWFFSALIGLILLRVFSYLQLRRWKRRGWLARTVAIVDLTGSGDRLARLLRSRHHQDVRLVGLFNGRSQPGSPRGIPALIKLSRLIRIDEILLTVSRETAIPANAAIKSLSIVPTNIRLCPDTPETILTPLEVGTVFSIPTLTVVRRPIAGWHSVCKRAEDLLIGGTALLLLWPLIVLVAIAIRLDSSGPVFFRQDRLGFNNNAFCVWKFRTMVHSPAIVNESEIPQARRGDPRVTRVGRWLRRSSLDEIPQLFNVLRGEMSLVGPRPHALPHNKQYAELIDNYLGRHRVLPGMTGLAQVNGYRGETEQLEKMERRVGLDLKYIENWSPLLDIQILLRTMLVLPLQKTAY